MPDTIQNEFLKLIKKFVRPEQKEQIGIETEEQWQLLHKLANDHHVVPMVYDALADMLAFKQANPQKQLLWKTQAVSLMILQTRKTEAFLYVYEKLKTAGIRALVVKGIVCRNLYAKPDARPSNDEDLYIQKKDLKECDRILLEEGYTRAEDIENPNYEISYDNKNNGVKIDVHISLFPEDMKIFKSLNKEFSEAFCTYDVITVNGKEIDTLNYELHFLYLLFHSYKHFVRCGFGIRQLCDMIVMAEEMGERADWKKIFAVAKKYNLHIFLTNIFDIGEKYLGFDRKKSGCPMVWSIEPDSENLLEDILDAGIYGKSSIGREHSVNITLSAAENKNGKTSLTTSLFPSLEYMKKEYEYLKKHSWLLPVAWGRRMLKYVRKMKEAKKIGDATTDSIAVGKQRIELLKQYGLIK